MMLAWFLQTTVCLAGFYAFYHFALRRETLFYTNRVYLLASAVASLLLPLVRIYIDNRPEETVLITVPYAYVGSYVSAIAETVTTAPGERSIPWDKLLMSLYMMGVVVMTARLAAALKDIFSLWRNGRRMQIAGHACVLSGEVKTPFSFFRTVYLPSDHAFSRKELMEVLSHETAHVQSGHTWDILFIEALCILLWPCPLIWLYRKSLKDVHEYAADAAVLKDTPWEEYAALLVSQQQNSLQQRLSHPLIYSQLKKRLLMMNKQRSGFAARYKYFGIVPIVLASLLVFSFRTKEHVPADSFSVQDDAVLVVTASQRYFLNGKEVPFDELVTALDAAVTGNAERSVKVVIDKSLTAGDMGELQKLADTRNIRLIFRTEGDELSSVAEEPLMFAEEMPVFPFSDEERGIGPMDSLYRFIYSTIRYPEADRDRNIEGTGVVRFVVQADGQISDVSILRSPSESISAELLRMMDAMKTGIGRWKPGRHQGKAVAMEFTLPVKFVLQDKIKDEKKDEPGKPSDNKSPFKQVDEMPRFPGCEHMTHPEERNACAAEKMYRFVMQSIRYPAQDRERHVEGTCAVRFVVEADGSFSGISILRSPSETISADVLRVMEEMQSVAGKWVPGKHEGKAVPVELILPVRYTLLEDERTGKSMTPANSDATKDSAAVHVVAEYGKADTKDAGKPAGDEAKYLRFMEKLSPEAEKITAAPNPAGSSLVVGMFEGATELYITDISGQVLLTRSISIGTLRETVDVSSLAPGQYIVRVTGGLKMGTIGFVKS